MMVYELHNLFTSDDQLVRIYDCCAEENVWEGELCELPKKYDYEEILSIDSIYKQDFDGYVTINIYTN